MRLETTKYVCDYCGKDVPSDNLSKIDIKAVLRLTDSWPEEIHVSREICNKCMEEMGLDKLKSLNNEVKEEEKKSSKDFGTIIKKVFKHK